MDCGSNGRGMCEILFVKNALFYEFKNKKLCKQINFKKTLDKIICLL